jgi:hypothetical protein
MCKLANGKSGKSITFLPAFEILPVDKIYIINTEGGGVGKPGGRS